MSKHRLFMGLSLLMVVTTVSVVSGGRSHLCPDFYDRLCPEALPAIRDVVRKAIRCEQRMGASLLRLHFHDCFVNGCDGSNLVDDTDNFIGEKTAGPNFNSLRGFDVIDEIKDAVNSACKGNIVSCADILAIAARDSISFLGGPSYQVLLGRRDARTASLTSANKNIPSPFSNFSTLLSNFRSHGLNLKDLVALSGAHTIGLARCTTFRTRVHNDANMDPGFGAYARERCPVTAGDGGGNNTLPLDQTATDFDTSYFDGLIRFKGLLHSDQELFTGDGGESDDLVRYYSCNPHAFGVDFGKSMINMGNIKPLTGTVGEIRMNCRKVN